MDSNLDRERLKRDIADANYAGRRVVPAALVWLAAALTVIAVIGAIGWGVKVAAPCPDHT